MVAGTRVTGEGGSVVGYHVAEDPDQDEKPHIVLDEPVPAGIADWLVCVGATDAAGNGGWLRPLRRRRTSNRLRTILGGAVVAGLAATGITVATVVAENDRAGSAVDLSTTSTDVYPPGLDDGNDRTPTLSGSAPDCGPVTIEPHTAVSGRRPLRAATGAQAIAMFEAAYYQVPRRCDGTRGGRARGRGFGGVHDPGRYRLRAGWHDVLCSNPPIDHRFVCGRDYRDPTRECTGGVAATDLHH